MQHLLIKNLVTKYFYRRDHLCFLLFFKMEDDRVISYKEYTDYAAYRHDFRRFQGMIHSQHPFRLRHVTENSLSENANMA